jgi:molybdate transport system substrate-binding protein
LRPEFKKYFYQLHKEENTVKHITSLMVSTLCLLFLAMPAMAGDVNLSVAASLKEVVNELSDGFAKKNPGVKFLKNYGASGALAKQIENGAPADIFISANLEWMEYLKNKKLVDTGSISTFAYNFLVFAGTAGKASSMQDLPKLEKIAIGSPKSVPAGEYAMESLRKAGLDKQLEKKLVMAKDVRECLMYAERSEVDGAFVYRTDALQAKQAKILFVVPQDLYPRVVYPLAMTVTGAKNADVKAFYSFLQSEEARTVLGKYGFVVR